MKYCLIISVLLLSGCASWPEEGQGGWAEVYSPANAALSSTWFRQDDDLLHADLEHSSLRLQIMIERGIASCMPAQVRLAKLMENRLKRQLAAQMFRDAEQDLIIFYHQITLLQRHFDLIRSSTQCADVNPQRNTVSKTLMQIRELLNSDNQFAFTDNKLTPKYSTRIKQAAELIRFLPNLAVSLTGHTDNQGDYNQNLLLGLSRANSVKAALVSHGVKSNIISTSTAGNNQPYAEGDSIAHRLSNRRVNAEVFLTKQTVNEQEGTLIPLNKWTQKVFEINGKESFYETH